MHRISSALTALILSTCVATAFAGGGGGGRGGRGGRGGAGGGGAGGFQGGGAAQGGAGAGGFGGQGNVNNGVGGVQVQPGGLGGRAAANGGGLGAQLGLNMAFYQNEYNIMLQQLTLSDDAKAKVQEKVNTMNTELQTFLQNSMVNLGGGGARGGRGAAGGRGGRGAAGGVAAQPATPTTPGQLTPEQVKIRDDFMLLADQHQLKIDTDLTDDQKLTWETYKLNLWLKPHLDGLQLADDQKDKVRSYVSDTAKAIVALTDGKDMETLEGRLFRKIVGDILTEQQASVVMQQLPIGPAGGFQGGAFAGGLNNGGANGNVAGNFNGGAGQGQGQLGLGGGQLGGQGGGRGGRGGRGGGGGGFGGGAGGGGFGGGGRAGGGFGGGAQGGAAAAPGGQGAARGGTGLP